MASTDQNEAHARSRAGAYTHTHTRTHTHTHTHTNLFSYEQASARHLRARLWHARQTLVQVYLRQRSSASVKATICSCPKVDGSVEHIDKLLRLWHALLIHNCFESAGWHARARASFQACSTCKLSSPEGSGTGIAQLHSLSTPIRRE